MQLKNRARLENLRKEIESQNEKKLLDKPLPHMESPPRSCDMAVGGLPDSGSPPITVYRPSALGSVSPVEEERKEKGKERNTAESGRKPKNSHHSKKDPMRKRRKKHSGDGDAESARKPALKKQRLSTETKEYDRNQPISTKIREKQVFAMANGERGSYLRYTNKKEAYEFEETAVEKAVCFFNYNLLLFL